MVRVKLLTYVCCVSSASWNASKSCIHSSANRWSSMSILFITTINGNRALYRIEQAYSMFDMNVVGDFDRGTSITYTTIVGKDVANASVMIVPDADHVNTSIWPGEEIANGHQKCTNSLSAWRPLTYLAYQLCSICVFLRLVEPNRPLVRISLRTSWERWQCLHSVPIGIVS